MDPDRSPHANARRLYALICDECFRDPVMAMRATEVLEEVRKRLGIEEADARQLERDRKAALARGSGGSRAFDAERVYRSACTSAWADGAMQSSEHILLRELAGALRIAPTRARDLRDEALEAAPPAAPAPGLDPDAPGPDRAAPASARAPGGGSDPVSAAGVEALLAGGRFGPPTLIGRGGMGAVYRMLDLVLGREVAVKVLRWGADGDERTRVRFLREARVLATLSHAGLPVIHDVSETPLPHIVMELLQGTSLQSRFAAEGTQPWEQVRGWLVQAADVLAHAHSRGVVHRDIKPDNLMLDPSGRVRVVDFGIALVEDATRVTEVGLGLGTLGFLPPEQVSATGMGPRSDVYALAATGYYLLSGRHPYTLPQLAVGRGFEATPLPPPVDPAFDRALRAGLALDPARRPATMSLFARLLMEGIPASGIAVAPTPGADFAARLSAWKDFEGRLAGTPAALMGPLDSGREPHEALSSLPPQALCAAADAVGGRWPDRPRELGEAAEAIARDLAALAAAASPQALLHAWGSLRQARQRLTRWLADRRVRLGGEVLAGLAPSIPFKLVQDADSEVEAEDPDELRIGLRGLLDALLGELAEARSEAVEARLTKPAGSFSRGLELTTARGPGSRPVDPLSWSSTQLLGAWLEARGGSLNTELPAAGPWRFRLSLPAALGIP